MLFPRSPRLDQNSNSDFFERIRNFSLLAVPQYADILECGAADEEGEEGEETLRSALVTSASAWRCELAKWIEEERENSEDDSDELPGAGASTSGQRRVRSRLSRGRSWTLRTRVRVQVQKQRTWTDPPRDSPTKML